MTPSNDNTAHSANQGRADIYEDVRVAIIDVCIDHGLQSAEAYDVLKRILAGWPVPTTTPGLEPSTSRHAPNQESPGFRPIGLPPWGEP